MELCKIQFVFGDELLKLICNVQELQEVCMELYLKRTWKSISALLVEDGCKDMEDEVQFSWIYRLKLNARVELFIWRLCMDTIPTEAFLFRRRLTESLLCPLGCVELEYVNHITTKCSKLLKEIEVLRGWGFSIPEFEDWKDCFICPMKLMDSNLLMVRIYFTLLWFVWNNKNRVKREKSKESNVMIVVSMFGFIGSGKQSLIRSDHWVANPSVGLFLDKWQPPPPEWVKINLNSSLKGYYEAGTGGIVRDSKGRFVLAFGLGKVHWDIAQLDLLAFSSLKEVLQGRLQDVKGIIVEGDNKNVLNILQNIVQLTEEES
ncbi:uncharacterized protein LOC110100437 [Dendrobium catenatum]|uniref:uncharacterized protein LOC110100437 n=1 Tax=Dendrobium catenatum TaxID=906689 RepID=UPI0009F2C346|nr:uncharacterized protein LOC110100437 [Dendrobium catenatum]